MLWRHPGRDLRGLGKGGRPFASDDRYHEGLRHRRVHRCAPGHRNHLLRRARQPFLEMHRHPSSGLLPSEHR